MAFKNVEARREYARKYYKAVKDGLIVPTPGGRGKLSGPLRCGHCSKEFYRPASARQEKGNYCSRKCMALAFTGRASVRKGLQIESVCASCGSLVVRPRWMHEQNEKTFCNSTCFGAWKSENWQAEHNPTWRGGKLYYYGSNWKRQSQRTRSRDGHCCKLCGVSDSDIRRKLDVHHIKPFRLFGLDNYKDANRLSNLVSLCPSCHCKAEKVSASGLYTEWETLMLALQ